MIELIKDRLSSSVDKNAAGIKEVTIQNFEQEVVEASFQKVVLVDFWAPWCGPCKQLLPVLEKAVAHFKGKVQLSKINIDESPELGAQLRIQSIPTVYAFVKGQPVDGFMGNVSEQKLNEFITRLLQMLDIPDNQDLESSLKQAQEAFDNSQYEQAKMIYTQILTQSPEESKALAGFAHCYLMDGKIHEAEGVLSKISPDNQTTSEAQSLIAHLDFLKERLKNISSSSTPYENALKKFEKGDISGSIEGLLHLIQTEKEDEHEKARTGLLRIFSALGHSHTLTLENRRKLSAILFS